MDSETFKRFTQQVDHILWSEWDPIGCGVPHDEYSFYAQEVAMMAARGEAGKKIIDYLHLSESERMGLGTKREDVAKRTAALVAKILALAEENFDSGT